MARIAPHLRLIGALTMLCSLAPIASAQWAWRDPNGRPVYSDQPPPPSIKAGDILQQPAAPPPSQPSDSAQTLLQPGSSAPSQPAPGTAPAPGAATAPGAAPAVAKPHSPTTAEREQEFRKRMKERAESEKKEADQQAQAQQKSENCDRARGYMKSLEQNPRLVRTNPDGSSEFLDADQRTAEIQRTQDLIQSSCN